MKEKNGITLIALVVTIIVLLILAAISLNVIIGENGVLQKAKEAKEENRKAEVLEELKLKHGSLDAELLTKKYEPWEEVTVEGEEIIAKGIFEGTQYDIVKYKDLQFKITYFENDTVQEIVPFTYKDLYIHNEEEMRAFANRVNQSKENFADTIVHLKADLDLKTDASNPWIKIGIDSEREGNGTFFSGIFDGEEHTIRGIYVTGYEGNGSNGLFSKNNGKISNLKIQDSTIKGSYSVGAIAGNNDGIIENCVSSATILSESNGITYCSIGGIVGTNNRMVRNCENYGNVMSSNKASKIGGIAGLNYEGSIINCKNYGKVEGGLHNDSCMGGILGGNLRGSIRQCINEGEVNGENRYVAGIVGDNMSGEIAECANKGLITTENTTVNHSELGGICSNNDKGEIRYCYNIGNIQDAAPENTSRGNYLTGIVCNNKGSVQNCYNAGILEDMIPDRLYYYGSITVSSSIKDTYENCFYNKELNAITETYGIGYTGEYMKSQDFLLEIGDKFKFVSGKYPMLKWE